MDYRQLPSGNFVLHNVSVPSAIAGGDGEFQVTDVAIAEGRIAEVSAAAPADVSDDHSIQSIDMQGAIVLPCFVDMHTHIDKAHILPRASNPDGTFAGALQAVRHDHTHWTANDVYRRADFSLRCAYAHGTRAVRTHLDSFPPQDEISWPVFDRLRNEWRGKIDLQAVCLTGCDSIDLNGRFLKTADLVQQFGGVLGLVAYPMEGLDEVLCDFLELAAHRSLDVDFHVDETMDPSVECVRNVCRAVLDTGFSGKVTVGHLCSLSAQAESRAADTLDVMAQAGVNVVSLPMCNLYLQDRHDKRTPRFRGITTVHEMFARGIPVAFASDNTRDPFYAYGDMDMLEVMREATRIGHLDHSHGEWPLAFNMTPADICGFAAANPNGQPANFVLYNARNWTELFARPQSDRVVVRNGKQIDRTLPDYRELDDLMEPA